MKIIIMVIVLFFISLFFIFFFFLKKILLLFYYYYFTDLFFNIAFRLLILATILVVCYIYKLLKISNSIKTIYI